MNVHAVVRRVRELACCLCVLLPIVHFLTSFFQYTVYRYQPCFTPLFLVDRLGRVLSSHPTTLDSLDECYTPLFFLLLEGFYYPSLIPVS